MPVRVRFPPRVLNTSKLGSKTRPNSEVKKIKNILQSVWRIEIKFLHL
jgi:hypothetical protein